MIMDLIYHTGMNFHIFLQTIIPVTKFKANLYVTKLALPFCYTLQCILVSLDLSIHVVNPHNRLDCHDFADSSLEREHDVVVPDRKQAKVHIFQFSFFFISKYTCSLQMP